MTEVHLDVSSCDGCSSFRVERHKIEARCGLARDSVGAGREMLEETGLFEVAVVTAPSGAAAATTPFAPDFSKFQVVVLNYDAPDERWSSEAKAAFERFVQNGGGVVAVHAADNAFSGWPAFNEMMSFCAGALSNAASVKAASSQVTGIGADLRYKSACRT